MRVIVRDINPAVVQAVAEQFADVPAFSVACGDIFSAGPVDAVISPANSFGHMDGGIDARYVQHFGQGLQVAMYDAIAALPGKHLPVGYACAVATCNKAIPYMISAPTMVTPGPVPDTNNAFMAFLAALLIARERGFSVLLTPGLATLVGGMPPEESASQMRRAWQKFQAMPYAMLCDVPAMPSPKLPARWRQWFDGARAGLLFRWGSCWIGAHYSRFNRRLCINFLPFVTLWITRRGGITPSKDKA